MCRIIKRLSVSGDSNLSYGCESRKQKSVESLVHHENIGLAIQSLIESSLEQLILSITKGHPDTGMMKSQGRSSRPFPQSASMKRDRSKL